ncbi:MAG: bifunctional diaminohydroxyphosphoribosylaminopyrimidine deaminase/5-amino-6-(5-phosphoribosylamino)uracil reductase RibD [Pseudomonadales bacterium]
MAHAIKLARRGWYTTMPNPRVGCVLVKNGAVCAEGWHEKAGQEHAEAMALRKAGAAAKGATAYITLEPCNHQGRTAPCTKALIAAGVREVFVAMQDPNPLVVGSGSATLQEAGIGVHLGLLEQEAFALNPGYIKRMRSGQPRVTCKLAMSLDGRTAMASGESRWITGSAARADVQRLRAQSCAVLSGVNTVLADNPAFTVRVDAWQGETFSGLGERQPLRVIVDTQLRTPKNTKLLNRPGNTVIVTCNSEEDAAQGFAQTTEIVRQPGERIDLTAVLAMLAQRECNEGLLECGPTLAGAMLQAELIDELVIYMAPTLLGSQANPLFVLPLQTMANQHSLVISDIRAVGQDWRISARPRSNE